MSYVVLAVGLVSAFATGVFTGGLILEHLALSRVASQLGVKTKLGLGNRELRERVDFAIKHPSARKSWSEHLKAAEKKP